MKLAEFFESNGISFCNGSMDLTKEIHVECRQELSKGTQGKKQGLFVNRWYGVIDNKEYLLSGKGAYKIYIDQHCIDCGCKTKQHLAVNSYIWIRESNVMQCRLRKRCPSCASKHNGKEGLESARQTNLKKYNVEWTGQRSWHWKQAHETKIKKYGKDYQKQCAKKAKQTYLEKYGVDHNGKIPEIRQQMVDTWKKTINSKTPEEWKLWNDKRLKTLADPKSGGLFGRHNKIINSKIANTFFDLLKSKITYDIIKEKGVGNYFVDFLIADNCIIEFYGDFWHANPKIYNEYDQLKYPGGPVYVKDIWERDSIRLEEIKKLTSLPVIVVWAAVFKKDKKKYIEKVCSIIKEINENERTNDGFVINID